MDLESYRRRKIRDFIESLGMMYCSTSKAFTQLVQHYLALDNVHTDDEFNDENVFE